MLYHSLCHVLGNLYYAYTTHDDQSPDRKFILAVRNSEMGTTQEGSDTILDIIKGEMEQE